MPLSGSAATSVLVAARTGTAARVECQCLDCHQLITAPITEVAYAELAPRRGARAPARTPRTRPSRRMQTGRRLRAPARRGSGPYWRPRWTTGSRVDTSPTHRPTGRPLTDLTRWELGVDEYAAKVWVSLANVPGVTVAGVPGAGKTSGVNKFVCDFAPSAAVQIATADGKVSRASEGDYADLVKRMFAFCGMTSMRRTRCSSGWWSFVSSARRPSVRYWA